MKATEVMTKYNITRQTLSNWVKEGKIDYIILPNGRYDYQDLASDSDLASSSVNSVTTEAVDIRAALTLLANMMNTELELLNFLAQINFMGPELKLKLERQLAEYKHLLK